MTCTVSYSFLQTFAVVINSCSLQSADEVERHLSHQQKCRFEEVDYSCMLRRELYEKEELLNNLRKHV